MKNYIKFTDFFSVSFEDKEGKGVDNFLSFLIPKQSRRYRAKNDASSNLTLPKTLGVRIAATHAGRVTGNMSFYLPDKMRKGTPSWLKPFEKPMLLHHDKEDDAVGRVKKAKYVDISSTFKNNTDWMKRADHIVGDYPSDVLIDAFIEGKLTPQEAADVVRNVFLDEAELNLTRDPSFQGLGYIELLAAISDPDTVQKILDERFLTGSIGARSSAAVCSVCKKDWISSGYCEHQPGKKYTIEENKKKREILCVVIAGDLLYDEYSYVNRPADDLSKNIEVFSDGVKTNSIECFRSTDDRIPEVCFNICDSLMDLTEEDNLMPPVKEEEKKEEQQEKTPEQDAEQKQEEVAQDPLKQVLGDEYDEILGGEPTEGDTSYVQMLVDAKSGLLDLSEEEIAELFDAKLNAKSRKALPKSVFCKPPDGYPVTDCLHARSAMAYAKKYNESSSVIACIRRKASRLGCPFKSEGKKDSLPDEGQFTLDWFDPYSDEELTQMNIGVDKAMVERGLLTSDAATTSNSEEDAIDCVSITNKITSLEKENVDLKVKLEKSKPFEDGLKKALEDNSLLHDQLLVANAENRRIRASHIVAFRLLAGDTEVAKMTEDEKRSLVEDLITKPAEELEGMENTVRNSVNPEAIGGILGKGLSRNPAVVVADPTLRYTEEDKGSSRNVKEEGKEENKGMVDSVVGKDGKEHQLEQLVVDKKELVIDNKYMEAVKENYLTIRMADGLKAAEKYLEDLKDQGLLPKENPTKGKSSR